MATYVITAPDGHDYQVEGEGTQEEALAHFQQQWSAQQPAAPTAPQGGSGRGTINPPNAQPDLSFEDRLHKAYDGGFAQKLGKVVGNVVIGMGTRARDNIDALDKELLTGPAGLPAGSDAEKAAASYQDPDAATLHQMNANTGTAGKIGAGIQDIAMTGPVGAEGASVVPVGKTILTKALQRGAEGAIGGGTTGALVAPGRGETRAGNALEGAGIGTVAGPVIGAAGDAISDAARTVFRPAAARVGKILTKALGQPEVDRITQTVNNSPAPIPMSVAAQAESKPLAAFEKTARANDSTGNWSDLDQSTKKAAWDNVQTITGDDIANVQPTKIAHQEAMTPFQNQLDRMPVGPKVAKGLVDSLEDLRTNPLFTNTNGLQALNQAQALVSAPNTTLGGLARLHSGLEDQISGATNQQRAEISARILSFIDSRSNGMLSDAYAAREAAQLPMEQAQAGMNVANDFQNPISGNPRTRSISGEPEPTSQQLNNSVNNRGTDSTDKLNPRDVMDPNTRAQLQDTIDALRKAEMPTQVKIAGGDIPGAQVPSGNPIPGMDNHTVALTKNLVNILLKSRNKATQEAASTALQSAKGWDDMIQAAKASNDLSASDAAMLAGILRASAPAAGAAVPNRKQ